MVRIMSDTSSTFTVAEGAERNIIINPLSISICDETYLDLEEITSDGLLALIKQGHLPKSSQPALGNTVALYNEHGHDDLINLCMTDGLSGTYQSAVTAVNCANEEVQDNIHVANTSTLWGNQRYIVEKAAKLAALGHSASEILASLQASFESHRSFLIPNDFSYLERGGRLSPMASKIGGALKLVPVMLHNPVTGLGINRYAICRNMRTAFQSVHKGLSALGVNESYHFAISHADVPQMAQQAKEFFQEKFPNIDIVIHSLSPAMITQGGPGCLAIQVVKK